MRNELLNTKLDVVLCSPLNRCKSTAEIICQDRDIPIIELERFTREEILENLKVSRKDVDYDWVEF